MGSIVIVDDHPLIRLAVRMMLEKEGHTIMAEVDNGSDALETVRKLLPDLIILDLSIPNMDGFAVISCLKSIGLAVKVLILTSGDSRNFAMRCLQAGAAGFICKDDNLDELVGAVKAVASGAGSPGARCAATGRAKAARLASACTWSASQRGVTASASTAASARLTPPAMTGRPGRLGRPAQRSGQPRPLAQCRGLIGPPATAARARAARLRSPPADRGPGPGPGPGEGLGLGPGPDRPAVGP